MRQFALVVLVACSSSGNRTTTSSSSSSSSPSVPQVEGPVARVDMTKPSCPDAVLVMENGIETGYRCATALRDHTLVDLRDAWTPRLFAPSSNGLIPEYRATYLAIAAETDTSAASFELYGIVPSLSVVRDRFAQAARYRCHAAIDSAPIAKVTKPLGQEHDGYIRGAEQTRLMLGPQLERERVNRKLASKTDLATDRELGPLYTRWKTADDQHAGIVAGQKHLVCDGYMTDKDADGLFSWKFGNALEQFQRRHFLMPNNRFDHETRTALATDPRELDFRFALRVLRERVVDATGLIEDGTAGAGPQPILGRMIDPEAMRAARGHQKPMPDAAPDLVSAATDAAAKQLGWTDPAAAAAFLQRHPAGTQVAIKLPRAPAYHAKHMQLSAVIDRGDVFYDDVPTPRVVPNRPSMVLYVDDGGTKRPLVRWPTTIGGWSDVRIGGGIVQRWKESDVGPRVWRDLFAAPTFLPPMSTPDRELVKWVGAGKWDLKRSIMGPGPHAAFGLMLLSHYRIAKDPAGAQKVIDNGIGTHGSATVMSIVNGTSHGCHRLYNQLAVRLGAFLLAHRDHVVKGPKKEYYRRVVRYMGTYPVAIDTRGFLYEMTPPVPVEVTRGRILTARKVPPFASAPALP